MDKDRIRGSAEQAKGKVKEVVGKVTGDSKLEGEGKADQFKGKVQNAVGGLKDTLRGKWIPHPEGEISRGHSRAPRRPKASSRR